MSKNKRPEEVDTHRNTHRDAGRENSQPYATETDDYAGGKTKVPTPQSGEPARQKEPPQ